MEVVNFRLQPKLPNSFLLSGSIFRDEIASPLELAVFKTEYLMRHKGAPHLRPPYLDLYWWQLALLDVFAFLAFGCLGVAVVMYKAARIVAGLLMPKDKKRKTN